MKRRKQKQEKPLSRDEWPDRYDESAGRDDRTRVLVENPDRATLWAYAEILREAGYEVATCAGEDHEAKELCPLLEFGHCGLVSGADVVVSTCSLGSSERVLGILAARGRPPVVFEAPAPDFERYEHLAGDAALIPMPVTEKALLDAVAEAKDDDRRA
jgi:hypothetical protein